MALSSPVSAAPRSTAPLWQRVAEAGERFLATRPRLRVPACSGLVQAVLARAGSHALGGSVRSMWADASARGWVHAGTTPLPGDVAFFDYTYDVNHNGRVDDPLSHVAVVLDVGPDGTITMVHWGSGAIRELVMNLDEPRVHTRDGRELNSYLSAGGYGADGRRLSGQLFRGFATPGRGAWLRRWRAELRRVPSVVGSDVTFLSEVEPD